MKVIAVFFKKTVKILIVLSLISIFVFEEVNANDAGPSLPDSVYRQIQRKIREYHTLDLDKSGFATILESLNKDEITSDSTIYQELMFHLISNAITEKKYNEAHILIDFIRTKISKSDFEQLGEMYYWESLLYSFENNYPKAESLRALSNKMFLKAGKKDFEGLLMYLQAHIIRLRYGLDEALPFYVEAIKVIDDYDIKYFQAVVHIFSYYAMQGEYNTALDYIQDGITRCMRNKNIKKEDIEFENVKYLNWYAHYLQYSAFLYREIAKSTNDSLRLLLKSFQDSQQSIIAIEKFKKQLNFESDILKVNKETEYIYFKSIEASSRLFKTLNADSLIVKMYGFSEMEKASALLRGLQKDISLRTSNLPDSVFKKAYELQGRLSSVEAKRYEQKADYNIVDDKILQANSNFYKLVADIEDLEKRLETNYPEYKKNKYNVLEPNVDFVKQLSKEKNIIEYVLSDEKIYSILINNGHLYFNDIQYDKGFKDSILTYHQQISNGGNLNFSNNEYSRFVELSNYLYRQLIEPFADKLSDKPLLIVPDNELSLIPFESLVQKPDVSSRVDYGGLPYLIKDYDISYTYSITLLEIQSKAMVDKNIRKVFAMAPGYNKLSSESGSEGSGYRDSLGPLKGAKQEVTLIRDRLKGKHYFNKKATEEEFKKHASEYSLLHLAMHTLINDEEPLYSKMIFTPDADSVEDGLLHTYELRELKLNADLVVLSACNTGFGRISNGEGIIGLSRGFLQSGCRSLLATLWSVSDLISIDIINGFYENLEAEKDLATSLSEAKRSYLENNQGFYTHPFFWSGFIVIGNTEPIQLYKTFPTKKLFLILSGILIASLLLLLLYKRKKPERFRLPVKLNKRN